MCHEHDGLHRDTPSRCGRTRDPSSGCKAACGGCSSTSLVCTHLRYRLHPCSQLKWPGWARRSRAASGTSRSNKWRPGGECAGRHWQRSGPHAQLGASTHQDLCCAAVLTLSSPLSPRGCMVPGPHAQAVRGAQEAGGHNDAGVSTQGPHATTGAKADGVGGPMGGIRKFGAVGSARRVSVPH